MPDQNPFDAMFAQPSQSVTPSAPAPAAAKTETENPFDKMFTPAGPATDSQKANPFDSMFTDGNATTSKPQQTAGNPFDVLFRNEAINNDPMLGLSEQERKESDPSTNPLSLKDEPWYSKTWDFLNKPLYDAHQWGVRTGAGTVERGMESGVEDLISGLTSPLSIGLTIGTLGGGTVADLGANGLRAIGVSKEAAPFVARGIKSLVDLGFTTQAVSGLVTQSPQFLDALKDGDYETAARLGTNILATGALTALGTKKTFEDAGVVRDAINGKTASQIETLKNVKKIAGVLDEDHAVAGDRARTLADNFNQQLKAANATDEVTQGAIRKYMLADGDLKLLKDQHDALSGALQPRQETPEETAVRNQGIEFKKWLGNSKFVDENGKPLVAYHGTMAPGDIEEFEPGSRFDDEGNRTISSVDPNAYLGPHFAIGKDAPRIAAKFATGEGEAHLKARKAALGEEAAPKVYPVHLKIENPKDFGSETNLNNFVYQGKINNEDLINEAMKSDGISEPEEGGKEAEEWINKYDNDPAFRQEQNRWIMTQTPESLGYEDQSAWEEAANDLGSQAKAQLVKAGFDGAIYNNEVEGGKAVVPVKDAKEQVRFAIPNAAPARKIWNRDFVYRAVDPRIEDQIRNAGLRPGEYHNSPEDAITKAPTPASGKREDLKVFAIPRSEAPGENFAYRSRDVGEKGVPGKSHSQATMSEDEARKYMAGRSSAQNGKPQELVRINLGKLKPEDYVRKSGPNKFDWIKFNRDLSESEIERVSKQGMKNILPSHEVVIDNGKPTGQVVPLRGDAPITLDNTRFQSEYTPEEKQKLLAQYKAALNLTPEQKTIAETLRNFYEDQFNKAHTNGLIRQAVENYHPQAWVKDRPGFFDSLFGTKIDPTNNAAFNQLRHQTDSGAFDTNVSAAKHRAFETEFQGEMAGYKSKTADLAYHAADYQHQLERAIAARKFLENLRKSDARAADGRPIVALSGSSRVIGEESGNPALLTNPNTAKVIAIANDKIQKMMQDGTLQDALNSGRIEKLPFNREVMDPKTGAKTQIPAYGWSTEGYQTIDHPSMRDWSYTGKDTAGNNALLKANMRVHPEVANYVRQVIGADTSAFKQSPYLRALMAAQRETKGALLAFSPFHAVQEGLRAVMLGINPFNWSPVHVADDPLLRLGVRNNLTFTDYRSEDAFSDGLVSHSKIIGKIPVANRLQDYIQRFTFEKLIPNFKARAFKSVYYRFLDRMPGAGADEVAHQAATYVNDVFGGQHWRDLGISATGQDAMRSIALAPDWLTSEMRMLYRASGGMGKPARQIAQADMLRLTAGLFVAARVINMLNTGKPHAEAPFGLVVPGKNGEDDKVYSLRTLPTDLVHALSDPRGFVAGRVNPLTVRTGIEAVEGRDEFGRRVTPGQEVRDLIQNFVPIGGQGLMKGGAPGGLTELDQLAKAAGTTVYKYRTEAEKLAQEKASDRMPSGPVDPAELATHQRNLRLEDGLRNGTISRGQVRRLTSAREAEQLIKNANRTGLQARFDRLPLRDALSVWELATPSEKDQLHKILWSKRVAYIQSHSPAERNSDPTWIKMQKVYADLHSR